MKKATVVLFMTAILCLAGCNNIEDENETTVTIDQQGRVIQLIKEELPSERYDSEELITVVDQQMADHNQEVGASHIVLKNSEIENGKVTMLIEYDSDDDYRAFNNVDFFAGPVSEAVEEEYGFAGKFISPDKKEVRSGTVPEICMEEQAIIIREPVMVNVPGEILYVSANMEIVDKRHVKMQQDKDDPYDGMRTVTDAYGYVIYRP